MALRLEKWPKLSENHQFLLNAARGGGPEAARAVAAVVSGGPLGADAWTESRAALWDSRSSFLGYVAPVGPLWVVLFDCSCWNRLPVLEVESQFRSVLKARVNLRLFVKLFCRLGNSWD